MWNFEELSLKGSGQSFCWRLVNKKFSVRTRLVVCVRENSGRRLLIGNPFFTAKGVVAQIAQKVVSRHGRAEVERTQKGRPELLVGDNSSRDFQGKEHFRKVSINANKPS